jgi:hypothetical protein
MFFSIFERKSGFIKSQRKEKIVCAVHFYFYFYFYFIFIFIFIFYSIPFHSIIVEERFPLLEATIQNPHDL